MTEGSERRLDPVELYRHHCDIDGADDDPRPETLDG
jgi:hypothetical protein